MNVRTGTLHVGMLALLAAATAAPALAQDAPETADSLVARIDKDGDGKISREEWLAAGRPESRFGLFDVDQDNVITVVEAEAALMRLGARA